MSDIDEYEPLGFDIYDGYTKVLTNHVLGLVEEKIEERVFKWVNLLVYTDLPEVDSQAIGVISETQGHKEAWKVAEKLGYTIGRGEYTIGRGDVTPNRHKIFVRNPGRAILGNVDEKAVIANILEDMENV